MAKVEITYSDAVLIANLLVDSMVSDESTLRLRHDTHALLQKLHDSFQGHDENILGSVLGV